MGSVSARANCSPWIPFGIGSIRLECFGEVELESAAKFGDGWMLVVELELERSGDGDGLARAAGRIDLLAG